MALTSTLFTGLSGLSVNQMRLNVVGNNIANVNTVAFKSSRVLFKPQFYVMDEGGAAPSEDFGGTNPSQRGLGAVVGAIEKNFAPGSVEPTGRATDMAIEGDGFFIVQSVSGRKYTRDGSFNLTSSNQLVTSGGEMVQGFGVDGNYNILPGQLQNIVIPLGTATSAKATENVTFQGNLNAAGALASGGSIYSTSSMVLPVGADPNAPSTILLTDLTNSGGTPLFSAGDVLTLSGEKGGRSIAANSLTVTPTTSLEQLRVFFNNTLGIAAIGGANTPGVTLDTTTTPGEVSLVIRGNTGLDNALSLGGTAFKNSAGTSPLMFTESAASNPTGESKSTLVTVYDSLGTPLDVRVTAVLESKSQAGIVWRFYAESADVAAGARVLGTGTLTFDSQGKLTESTGNTVSLSRTSTGALDPLSFQLDFGPLTSLTDRSSDLVIREQDGSGIGTLDSFSIGADGIITGSFSNGLTRTLGQVAVATFANPQGLTDSGGNLYDTGPSSGVAVVTTPLRLGAGSVRSGALELSNVDLSQEFINLIVSSTGFSAASRVITTSDQLLNELLNASR